MKKSAIVLLIFSLVFVTLTSFLLVLTTMFVWGSLDALYKPDADLGSVLGGIFLFIAMIPYCLGTIASSALILPFNLIMRFKMKIKTWYTLAVFIFAIAAIATAVLLLFAVPIASGITQAGKAASSSSSSSSVAQ